MPKSYHQKIKILILEKLLLETGNEDRVSMQKILAVLSEYGIQAERKSIYDDLEALRDFGYGISYQRGRNGGYYLTSIPQGEKQEEPEEESGWRVCQDEICGTEKKMKLSYPAEVAPQVKAYFGALGKYKEKSAESGCAVLPRVKGPQFFGWLVSMEGAVEICKPKKLGAAYRDYLKALGRKYREF